MYRVILYYNFASIDDEEVFCREHKKFCQSLNLLGRIYVAKEGINGTIAGTEEQIEEYIDKFIRPLLHRYAGRFFDSITAISPDNKTRYGIDKSEEDDSAKLPPKGNQTETDKAHEDHKNYSQFG